MSARHPFLLYRIIGNPLPPRHDPEDTYALLRLILENEPELPGCDRRWILNRMIDPALREKCREIITSHGQGILEIPYNEEENRMVLFDYTGLPHTSRDFKCRVDNPDSAMDVMAAEWITRHKSRVLIGINHARNEALRIGKTEAEWTLPLDGWAYFSRKGWEAFAEGVKRAPKNIRYAVIPLVRMTKRGVPDKEAERLAADDEPQVAFRHNAPDRFNPLLRYGNRNKTEFLDRIGCHGFWTPYKPAPWDKTPETSAEAPGAFISAGRLYRLAPGAGSKNDSGNRSRALGRIKGRMIASLHLDADVIKKRIENSAALAELESRPGLPPVLTAEELSARSDYIEKFPPGLIVSKKVLPEGCKQNDFFTEYPKPDESFAQPVYPCLCKEGEGEDHDRRELRSAISSLTTLTRAGIACVSEKRLAAATQILTVWFLHGRTRMTPRFDFAGLSHEERVQDPAAILEIKDLWIVPRMARILEEKGALAPDRCEAFRNWCSSMLSQIVRTDPGKAAYDTTDSVGTWTHLLAMSLCVHARHPNYASRLVSSLTLRLVCHCREGGVQPHAFLGAKPLFLSLFNATAWVFLAHVTRLTGFDLWGFRGEEGESISMMLRFLQSNMEWFPESREPGIDHSLWLDYLVRRVPSDAADAGLLAPPKSKHDPKDIPREWGFLDPCDF